MALLSGVPAKEIVVSTLGVLYPETEHTPIVEDEIVVIGGADGPTAVYVAEVKEADDSRGISARLVASGDFTPASALAFLVFILIYFPCIASIAAIGAEAGWRWAAFTVVYNSVLAWVVSYAVYHLILWL